MFLQLKNIKKAYKYGKERQSVLQGIDLAFNSGEFVSVLGESGCGKSTLMNIIGGMDLDYEGEVLLNDKNIKKTNLDNYRKLDIGFVFQNFNLIPHLSVLDNVIIALEMSSRKDKAKIAKELLNGLGLKDHLHKKPNQLSGGQKQRVAIARALANNPQIILADEPTGSLDQKSSEQIIKILKDIAESGKLVIMVTHSNKVASNGTRIIRMSDGVIENDELIGVNKAVNKEEVFLKPKSLPFIKAIQLAMHNMRLNLKRNMLVTIGGSIGILSVVLMFGIGNGVKTYINDQISASMDPNLIQISKANPENKDEIRTYNQKQATFIKEDIDKINSIENIDYINKVVTYNMNTNIILNDKNIMPMTFTTSLDGYMVLTDKEKKQLPKDNELCVSDSLAKKLLGTKKYKDIIGKTVSVYINDQDDLNKPVLIEKTFLITGVIKIEDGSYDAAVTTYKTLEDLYAAKNITLKPTGINIFIKDINKVSATKDALTKAGFKNSQIAEMLNTVTMYLNIATLILAGIASISLLVSGIMILVVLYISVVERTKEIGILRAIGARRKDIRRIFFTESAMLGFFSGLIGVLGALLISFTANNYIEASFKVRLINVNLTYIVLGILVSIMVSIIAGLMPASKASKLDPMESLRYE